jgi:hypothetical protein
MNLLQVLTVAIAAIGNDLVAPDPGNPGVTAGNPYGDYVSTSYQGTQHWLCHPGLSPDQNACSADLTTIVVKSNGNSTLQPFTPSPAPAVDCFYVYPTVSTDPAANSDFYPDAQEIQTTMMQAARYGAVCRVFAPIYRQRTLSLLALDSFADEAVSDERAQQALELAYADVLDAFREYIAHHNHGRGFLLLGHSQGSIHLARLIAEEVERHPYLAERLVAAHIPGTNIAVPAGLDVGGTFASTPACRHPRQTGCVITYASYRAGDPELSDPRYGVVTQPGMQALCVNPASLGGGRGKLEVYFPFVLPPVFQAILKPRGTLGPYANPATNIVTALTTPFFSVPGQFSGECVVNERGASYLEIRIAANPEDPRADDYPAEFFGGTGWGMHLVDVNLAQGNLVKLARTQSAAWLDNH